MDHKGEDSHLCSTSIVKLNGGFTSLLSSAPSLGIHVIGTVGGNRVLFLGESELNSTNKKKKLKRSTGRDGIESSKSRLYRREGNAVSDISGKSVAGTGHEMAKDGKHSDTAVLDLKNPLMIEHLMNDAVVSSTKLLTYLNISKSVESILIGVLEQVKRIPESKRSLGTELTRERHLEGITRGLLGHGGESRS